MGSGNLPPERGRSKKLELAAYFYAKIESGKDSAFKKYESPCSQCKKGVTLDKGVKLRGGAGRQWRASYTFSDLYSTYQSFESKRLQKAQETLKRDDLKPDSFSQFIAERTDLCPHSIITQNTFYWMETVNIFDSEMGLTLPGPVDEIPGLFWDCLSIVRSAKAQVRKEEKK